MRIEFLLWAGVTVHFATVGVLYGLVGDDPAGTALLLIVAGLGGLVAGWTWDWRRQHDIVRPEDRGDADAGDETGIVGIYPTASLRPLALAVGMTATVLGVVVGSWMVLAGAAIVASQVALLVRDAGSMMVADTGVDHVAIGAAAVLAVAVYALAWTRHPGANGWRLWSWAGGIALLVLASSPWIERIAEESFTGHMVQHLIVIALAAPLLVLAQPVRTVSVWVPPTAAGRRVGVLWHRGAAVIGPLVFVVVLFATHLTSIYDRALHDRWVHELEHAAYLLGAVLTWAALVGAGRRSASVARVGAAFGLGVGGAVLGMILLSATEPLVPTYEARLGAARALTDQRTAAALMWVGGMVTTVPLLVLAVWRWAAAEERIARRSEALGQP